MCRNHRGARVVMALGIVSWGLAVGAPRDGRAAGVPEISGTSMTADDATLVYGAGFDDKDLAVHVQEPARKDQEPAWGEAELRQSLERVQAGQTRWPAEPEAKDRGWRRVEHKEDNVLLCHTGGHASSYPAVVKVLRVRSSAGTSRPWVLNRPEVWGVSPRRPAAGETVSVWGVNIGSHFALVGPDGRVAAVCRSYLPYCMHSGRPEHRFFRMLLLPATLAPGRYVLYAWGGFEDLGWSEEGFPLEVIGQGGPPAKTIEAKSCGVVGDGVTDDTQALRAALAKAAEAGAGRVLLPVGRFVISGPLDLPEGVHLVGQSAEATIIEASRWKTFEGEVPERAFSRPADYDPKTYKPVGWGIDWYREDLYRGRTYMVWLKSDTGIEHLTLDGTASSRLAMLVLLADEKGQVCRRPVVRACRLLCERMGLYGQWPDFHDTQGILITCSTEDMLVERTRISVNGVCLDHLPGYTRWARIRYNTFTTCDPHCAYELWMPRTTQYCLIEGNTFENGGRGKTEQAHGFPYPVTRNCYVHNIFRNLQKGDGEVLMYETGGLVWFGRAAGADPTHVTAAAEEKAAWKPDEFKGFTVVVHSGRGMGQFRTVVGNTPDTLAVDKPWRVIPDRSSTFGLLQGGVIENVHVGNEFFYCHYYCGIYGSGLRNVWVNEVYESVGGGTFLWPIAGARVMALNLLYGQKYHERAGVVVTNDRRPGHGGKPTEAEIARHQALQKCFGNEVRACSIRARSYVSTENGQIWTRSLRYHWAQHGRSSPINPLPGTEAAIAVWDTLQWAGWPEEPELDKLPSSTRWNLLAENQIVRCAQGILIGKAVEKTILASNSFYECPTPVTDLGRGTVNLDSFVCQGGKPLAVEKK